jgi:hypothetical protein
VTIKNPNFVLLCQGKRRATDDDPLALLKIFELIIALAVDEPAVNDSRAYFSFAYQHPAFFQACKQIEIVEFNTVATTIDEHEIVMHVPSHAEKSDQAVFVMLGILKAPGRTLPEVNLYPIGIQARWQANFAT